MNKFQKTRSEESPLIMRENVRNVGEVFVTRSLFVDILAIFFGIGTWVGVNGTFIQLPLLVEEAPEGWSLPSYLSVMVQVGNLGPLIYTLLQNFATIKKKDSIIIYILLAIGTSSSLLTAFFYNQTAVVFGKKLSIALYLLTFLTSLNACTSSVLFMPYMGRFKEIYLISYFIGEGLSGLLPSLLALVQGIGSALECVLETTENGTSIYVQQKTPPRFGMTEYFLFVFAMMLCSCVGFTLLDKLKLAKKQYSEIKVNKILDQLDPTTSDQSAKDISKISSSQYMLLLVLIGVISFFSNGMFNSIQSYSCLPYGNNAYHLAATLGAIANPIACFLAVFLPRTSRTSISVLSGLAGLLTVYVFVTAVSSPKPPLYSTTIGASIVVIVWTLLMGLVSYVKLCISSVMHAQGGKSLIWTGCLTQFGSAVGSILIFFLINSTTMFIASQPC